MADTLTIQQIADAIGIVKSSAVRRAKKGDWIYTKRAGRGGGRQYSLQDLPQDVQTAILSRNIATIAATNSCTVRALPIQHVNGHATGGPQTPALAAATAPAVVPIKNDVGHLKNWQTQIMDARLQIIRLVEHAEPTIGVTQAIKMIVQKSRTGALPKQITDLIPAANARATSAGNPTLSQRTLMRWWGLYKNSGGDYTTLAPVTVQKNTVPLWANDFLAIHQTPQNKSPQHSLRLLAQQYSDPLTTPSIGQVKTFLKKYSKLDINRGRKTGSNLRGQRIHRQRDTSMFYPLDIVQVDGHSFKAAVQHPDHGRPFKPEICTVIDTVTRAVIGWSVGLAESAETVSSAISHAIVNNQDKPLGGLPLILYADKGAGNLAELNSHEIAGRFPRAGIDFKTGRPGNPQGRGLVERLNSSLWIPAAKELQTYSGKNMDSGVARTIYLTTQKEVRQADKEQRDIKSPYLITWPQFIDFCQDHVHQYNHRPHSGLDKITDSDGKRRHMTPAESWVSFLNIGWKPDTLDQNEINHLFRPHKQVKCNRGIITLWTNKYSDPALEHYHGQNLIVGFDQHDPSKIWVRDSDLRLIVIAKRDANKSPFFSVDYVEKKREDRYQNRIKTAQRNVEEIELERQGTTDITAINQPVDQATIDRVVQIEADANKPQRISSPLELYMHLDQRIKDNDQTVTDYQKQWVVDYQKFTETGFATGLYKTDEYCNGGGDVAEEMACLSQTYLMTTAVTAQDVDGLILKNT